MIEIQIKREALLNLLRDLIQIESVNPSLAGKGSGEAAIARYIGNYLSSLGLAVRFQEIEKNRVNVVGILKGSGGGPSLMLNGHTDTVNADAMEIDPFAAEEKRGKIYGRGALDMKAGIAALIMAVQSITEAEITLKGDVILTLVHR